MPATSSLQLEPLSGEDSSAVRARPHPRSLRRNTLWNLAGNGLPLIAGAAAIPLLLRRLGTEQFGIVTLVWTVIGYLSLFDFGLGRALTQLTARNAAASRHDENLSLLRTAVYLTAAAGLVGAVALAVAAQPLSHRWLGVSAPNQRATFQALLLTALAVPITTVSAALRGALEGHEEFARVNIVRLFLGISTFLFPAVAVTIGPATLPSVVVSLLASRVVTLVMFLRHVRAVHPSYRFSVLPHLAHGRQLLTFGSWMTVSNVISPLLVNVDRFVISGAIGAAVVAFYTVPFEIIVRLQIIPGAIGASLFPRLAGATDARTVRPLVARGAYVTAAVMGVCCAILVVGYVPGVSVWLGKEFAARSYLIAAILAGGALLNGVAYIFYTAVQARTGSRATGLLHVTELVLYVPVLLLLVRRFGILGAAAAWTARVALDCALLVLLYARTRREPA